MADTKSKDLEEQGLDPNLEHTAGGKHTRDVMDAGVPMAKPAADDPGHQGPEDALGDRATRGDYSDRIDSGPHMVAEPVPADERVPGGPTQRLVPQGVAEQNAAQAAEDAS
jgi:hypothetical protein